MPDLSGVACEIERAAVISKCGAYRYSLTRKWSDAPLLSFVMLNPSTADAKEDDPTIRRCIGFARREGAGGLIVANLYALRSSSPEALWAARDPIGPQNRRWRSLASPRKRSLSRSPSSARGARWPDKIKSTARCGCFTHRARVSPASAGRSAARRAIRSMFAPTSRWSVFHKRPRRV